MDFLQPDEHNRLDGRRNSRERRSSKSQTIFSRIQNIGEGFARKAAFATELLADRELRRYDTGCECNTCDMIPDYRSWTH